VNIFAEKLVWIHSVGLAWSTQDVGSMKAH